MSVEREIRFALEPEEVDALLSCRRIRKGARGERREQALVSTYFDTRRHALRRAGAALRIREGAGAREQTLKVPTDGPAGVQNCEEWTVAAADGTPDLRRFEDDVLARLPQHGRRLRLEPVFHSDVKRTTLRLGRGRSRFEMAIDVGRLQSLRGTQAAMPLCEVEFELLRGTVGDLLDFLIDLVEDVKLLPLYPSKAQRGYVLARRSLQGDGVKAQLPALRADATVGDAFQVVIGEALRHLYANTAPVLAGAPGGIHQSRVAIRRIRAALRAFKEVLPYEGRKAFNGEFRWFQDRLSPARDWHVFVTETLPRIDAETPAGAVDLERLAALARQERRRATADAVGAVASRRYLRLLLRFQRWLLDFVPARHRALRRPLQPLASHALAAAVSDLLTDRRSLGRMSEEDRHELRKRTKKARYAMEFFAGLWAGADAQSHIAALEAFQDHLGEANDAVVARHLMAGVSPQRMDPALLLVLQRWSREREGSCTAAAQPLWRRVRKAPAFWA